MAPRRLTVIKKPRNDPLQDIPINFPPLENLHLELMENKRKIKKGLPLVPIQKKRPPPLKVPEKENYEKQTEKIKQDKPEKKKRKVVIESSEEEDDNIKALEDDDSEDLENIKESEEDTEEEEDEETNEEDEDDPYAGLSPEEREVKEKEEYLWRFRILKKQYKNPSTPIPSFNEHSDLGMMKNKYDETIKELYLDDTVESYRSYLVGGFMLMEFGCTQFMNIDLGGFTSQQMMLMHKYDRMLIELGEKSYNTWSTNLPVEIRLMGFVLFQAGIFYLGKIIAANFGSTFSELFQGMTGQPPSKPQETEPTEDVPKKKKMRGPRIRPEDLRRREKED